MIRRKIKFPLEMKNGVLVRDLKSLQDNFDLACAIRYLSNGDLLKWLQDHNLPEAADIEELSINDSDVAAKLCKILGVDSKKSDIDVRKLALAGSKLDKLRQYTDDPTLLKLVDSVAYTQSELDALVKNDDIQEVILCDNSFTIDCQRKNMIYIGIGDAIVVIKSDTKKIFEAANIHFTNVQFNSEYDRLVNMDSIDAMIDLGNKYRRGDGVDTNFKLAMEQYERAVQHGNSALAMRYIGDLYHRGGFGIKSAPNKADEWYEKAAALGNYESICNLARRCSSCGKYRHSNEWALQALKIEYTDEMAELIKDNDAHLEEIREVGTTIPKRWLP